MLQLIQTGNQMQQESLHVNFEKCSNLLMMNLQVEYKQFFPFIYYRRWQVSPALAKGLQGNPKPINTSKVILQVSISV